MHWLIYICYNYTLVTEFVDFFYLLLLLVVSAIISGQLTDPKEYPWNIQLVRNGWIICTGVIINPLTVLTLVQCVQR